MGRQSELDRLAERRKYLVLELLGPLAAPMSFRDLRSIVLDDEPCDGDACIESETVVKSLGASASGRGVSSCASSWSAACCSSSAGLGASAAAVVTYSKVDLAFSSIAQDIRCHFENMYWRIAAEGLSTIRSIRQTHQVQAEQDEEYFHGLLKSAGKIYQVDIDCLKGFAASWQMSPEQADIYEQHVDVAMYDELKSRVSGVLPLDGDGPLPAKVARQEPGGPRAYLKCFETLGPQMLNAYGEAKYAKMADEDVWKHMSTDQKSGAMWMTEYAATDPELRGTATNRWLQVQIAFCKQQQSVSQRE